MNLTDFKSSIITYFKFGEISKKRIIKYLSDDPIIVEAGAHIGIDTIEMSKLWPKGTIHAFEPVSNIFEQLSTNTRQFNNVNRYKLALGNKTEKRKIFISSGISNASSSLLRPKEHLKMHPDVLFEQDELVDVITLNDWVKKYNINRIDFLWLDLQGNELAVLKAAEELIPEVRVIYTEINLIENYEGCSLYSEIKAYLYVLGFSLHKEKLPWADAGNALFVNNKIRVKNKWKK